MKKSTFILIYGIVLFVLTTCLLIAIPLEVSPLDTGQWVILAYFALCGYLGTGICLYTYRENLKEQH